MFSRSWQAIQVACVYVGTVVGAGFASGQELRVFFGRHGVLAAPAALLATVLFAAVGYRVMLLGQRVRATSYASVSRLLFGPRLAVLVNVSLTVMMFGIAVAMLAGAGELFRERVQVPFSIGAACTALLTFFTLLWGMKGLFRANTLIVPAMLVMLCIACVRVAAQATPRPIAAAWPTPWPAAGPAHWAGALLSAVVYVAFNVGLAAGVLIPLGAAVDRESTLKSGAMLGAAALGLMMVAVLYALALSPQALGHGLPMAYIASRFGPWFSRCFAVVLFGEIYSTLAGDLFAIVAQLSARATWVRHTAAGLLLGLAFAVCHIGFTAIVTYGYSFFGWLSTVFLAALLWPRAARPNRRSA